MHSVWICLAVQIYNNYMHIAILMATVEVSHKAAGVFVAHLKSPTVT